MTFNILYDDGAQNNTQTSWDSSTLSAPNDRRDRVVSVISTFGPDVLGVQEMLTNQRDYLQASPAMSDYGYYGVGRNGGDSGERSGIFYRNSRFTLVDQGQFWLSSTSSIPGTTFWGGWTDIGNPRMATWVKLRDKQSPSHTYFVMDTHWSTDTQAREDSGALMRSKIAELSGGLPTIVMGDLNETHADSSLGYWKLRGRNNPTDFQLADAYDASGSPQGSSNSNWVGTISGDRIDHILASAGMLQSVAGSGNIVRTSFAYGYPSDHYPITVELRLVPEPSTLVMLLTFGFLAVTFSIWRGLAAR